MSGVSSRNGMSAAGSDQTQAGNGSVNDPNKAIDKKIKDTKLMNLLIYITDYMRQVMESGQRF
jgi:hypothetical protein